MARQPAADPSIMASSAPRGRPPCSVQSACVNHTENTRSVQLFKITGLPATQPRAAASACSVASTRTRVGRHDVVVEFHVAGAMDTGYGIKFRATLTSDDATDVSMALTCRVRDQLGPSPAVTWTGALRNRQGEDVVFVSGTVLADPRYVKDGSIVVECVIATVVKVRDAAAANALAPSISAAGPSSDLHEHFGELLRSQKGSDATFLVAGERIAAHKCVLAARSPVFMAELLGDDDMSEWENASQQVEIEDMEADVFRALIKFIYTDRLPDLDSREEGATTLVPHLLAAADRYGMGRLKVLCEDKMCGDISVATAAAALVLAEKHGCPKLKARCMEFIVADPADLQAIVATDGYKHLLATCPSVLSDLLLASVQRGRGC
ncbi:hypothetical protein EJB05_41898 [Eragrostis curvula]|uniref:BTB domain-containing protein n=1 Tax=Eragrostis curvula TaxID=38414 RepID=A0A5J9TAU9_9POAL|nr:hypothetical protein EJB05_41898 [Eragrostis curvula]